MLMEEYLYLSNIKIVPRNGNGVQICFPEGCQVDPEFTEQKLEDLCGRNLHRTPLGSNAKVIHFTITQSSGVKKYLTALQYKEIALVRYHQDRQLQVKLCFVPKCLCLVSKIPLFSLHKQMLLFLHEELVKQFHRNFLVEYNPRDDPLTMEAKLRRTKHQSRLDRLEFYLSLFFHHLQLDGSNTVMELHRRVPTSGQQKSVLKFVNNFNKECLRMENYEFRYLFEKVTPVMFTKIFVCLLHERKVVLVCSDCSKNAILIEALLQLMYPLQWNFTNISYMTPSMAEYLEAPFPYLIGLSRELWKEIQEHKWDALGEDLVAFDLETNKIFHREELPPMPKPFTQQIVTQLEKHIGSRVKGAGQEEELAEELFWHHFTLKVKQQFLNFMIFLINDFEKYYLSSPVDDKPKFGGTQASTLESTIPQRQPGSANDIFDFEGYLFAQTENRAFYEKFLTTQAFINFIEQSYYEEHGNIHDASIRFFKESLATLNKECLVALKEEQNSIIEGLLGKLQSKRASYSVEQCQVIYEKSLDSKRNLSLENPGSQKGGAGIVNRVEHERVVKMKPYSSSSVSGVGARFEWLESLPVMSSQKKKASKIKLVSYAEEREEESPQVKAKFFESQKVHLGQKRGKEGLMGEEEESPTKNVYNVKSLSPEPQDFEHNKKQKGLFGFLKNKFSNLKKTFENTLSKPGARNETRSKTPCVDPGPANRGNRSNTFHGKSGDSFLMNVFAGAGHNTTKHNESALGKHKKLNGSGLIAFKEEDFKSMMSLSPRNKSGRIHYRPHNEVLELAQATKDKYKPVVKDMPKLEQGLRLRSISQKVDEEGLPIAIDKKKLFEYMNESCGSINDRTDEEEEEDKTPKMEETLSPEMIGKRQGKVQDKIAKSNLVREVGSPPQGNDQNQLLYSQNNTLRKEPLNTKQEFEEQYKKSTEKLLCMIPAKNTQNGFHHQQFTLWNGPSSGRNNAKPPKPLKESGTRNARLAHKYRSNDKDELGLGSGGISSELNTTEEEAKVVPNLSSNLSKMKKQAMTGGVFKGARGSLQQAGTVPKVSHKRLVSEVAGVGGAQTRLGSKGAHENIDPEEHKRDGRSNKVIESMQVGRSKGSKHSTMNKFSSKPGSRKNSNTGIPNMKKQQKVPVASTKAASNPYINFQKFRTAAKKEEDKVSHHQQQQQHKGPPKSLQSSSNNSSSYQSSINSNEPYAKPQHLGQSNIKKAIDKNARIKTYNNSPQYSRSPPESKMQRLHLNSNLKQAHFFKENAGAKAAAIGRVDVVEAFKESVPSDQVQSPNCEGIQKIAPTAGNRMHSMSQYHDKEYKVSGGKKPLRRIDLSPQQEEDDSSKPLSKMQSEAFNQIAKLTGDVDLEPSPPRSDGVLSSSSLQ